MKEIKNFYLEDFLKQDPELQERYTKILMLAPAVETKKPFWDLTFAEVSYFVENGLKTFDDIISVVAKLQRTKKSKVYRMRICDFFPIVSSVKDQIKKTVKALEGLGNGPVNLKWELVNGSDRMKKYGVFNITIPLAEQFGKLPSDIEKMKFGEVFAIRSYNNTLSTLQKEMSEIKLKTQ